MSHYNCAKYFFGRFQPPHIGHFGIIERTARDNPENCKIFVFVSPKSSRPDIARKSYGQSGVDDRYPLTVDARADILRRELAERGLDDIDVLTDARTAQSAIKEIIRISGEDNGEAGRLEPEDIELILGADEEGPFKRSFYGRAATSTHEDRDAFPEKYVGMTILPRASGDVSATRIREKLIPLIQRDGTNMNRILSAIKEDAFLDRSLPQNTNSRKAVIREYLRKMSLLHEKGAFGRFSAFAIGGRRRKRSSRRKKSAKTRRRRRKTRKK